MLRIMILAMVLAAAPSDSVHPREIQDPDCPKVWMACPTNSPSSKLMKFTVSVTGGKRNGDLSYNWTVTKGKIKSGQGTTTIEVDLEGKDCQELTATVEIGGIDPNCPRAASCTMCIP